MFIFIYAPEVACLILFTQPEVACLFFIYAPEVACLILFTQSEIACLFFLFMHHKL